MFFLEITNPTFSYAAPLLVVIACFFLVVVGALAVPMSRVLMAYIKEKTGVTVSEANRKKFVCIVDNAVLQVEQLARKALKLGEEAPDGARKLESAVEKVEQRLKDEGLYDEYKDMVVDQIESCVAALNGGPVTPKEKDDIRANQVTEITVDDDPAEKKKTPKIIGGESTK